MPYRQSNDRHPPAIEDRGTIQMSSTQVRLDHEHDPVLSQKLLCESRAAIEYAHVRDLMKKIIRQGAGHEITLRRLL